MKLSIILIACLLGLSLQNTYIKANYTPENGQASAFRSVGWNQKFQHKHLYRVTNDNDPKITLGVDNVVAGAQITQRRFDPTRGNNKNRWILTKAKNGGGNGYNIHALNDPNMVWTRPKNWYTNQVGDVNITLQQLDDDNPNQVWAWKLGGQMWAFDYDVKKSVWETRKVGFLDVVHCTGGQQMNLVIRRETNARQQIWHWHDLGVECPGDPRCTEVGSNEVNLVEMMNWQFQQGNGIGAVAKEFKCESLNDARRYARLFIKNQGGLQTLLTWYKDQSRITVRYVSVKGSNAGPRVPVPAPNVYTFAEGIQIAYKNSNFFIFLQSVLARGGKTITNQQLREVTEHVWNLGNKKCWDRSSGKRRPKDTISAEDARDFTVSAMQATNTPVVEKAIDGAFKGMIKNKKRVNCRQMIGILKNLSSKWGK